MSLWQASVYFSIRNILAGAAQPTRRRFVFQLAAGLPKLVFGHTHHYLQRDLRRVDETVAGNKRANKTIGVTQGGGQVRADETVSVNDLKIQRAKNYCKKLRTGNKRGLRSSVTAQNWSLVGSLRCLLFSVIHFEVPHSRHLFSGGLQ